MIETFSEDPDAVTRFVTSLLGDASTTYALSAMRIEGGVSLDIRARPDGPVQGGGERAARLQIVGATVRILLDGRFESDEICDDPHGCAEILEEFLGFARAYLADDGDWRLVGPGFGIREALAFDFGKESYLFVAMPDRRRRRRWWRC